MNKQHQTLRICAFVNQMRAKIEANEYKDRFLRTTHWYKKR